MNAENAIKTAVGFFVVVLVSALLSALVGGAFGALVAISGDRNRSVRLRGRYDLGRLHRGGSLRLRLLLGVDHQDSEDQI